MKYLFTLCLLFSSATLAADAPNAERGRLLYENHCMVCHTAKVHGRIRPLPLDMKELRSIIAFWAKNEKLSWTEQEIDDVAQYLDITHYRFRR